MIYFFDLFGTIVFAITGALVAGRKRLDLFGGIVLALATALGGGTLRDLILGAQPVFWVQDPIYIYVATAAAILTFPISRLPPESFHILKIADAFGLAVFTVIGAQKALAFNLSPIIVIMMGVMTAVVGGMIRDILSGEIPMILRREIYATASFCGALVYILIIRILKMEEVALYITMGMVLGLRLAAIHWGLSLPRFSVQLPQEKD